MNDLNTALALKAQLDRTWPAFFARHGNFTPTQLAAIPAILSGANVMLCAPTASGKTEAVIAPLIERHISPQNPPESFAILYLAPTKALVNDLCTRLSGPLESMRIRLGVKTRDMNTVNRNYAQAILITTPESCDSLLTTQAKAFINVRAIVLDELHLFDGTPRGDHLRVILNRIRRICAYAAQHGDAPVAEIQFAAISASMAQPERAAARYFPNASVIEIGGTRSVEAELNALSTDYPAELIAYLDTLRSRGWKKALAFCNSRVEVEAYAAAVRQESPFGDTVFVHYSNLEAKHRREIEQRFSAAEVAICFASSTLELGIDIGSIDVILLIGAPGSTASFVQRAGRGSRRQSRINLSCFYRTELEKRLFETLCAVPTSAFPTESSGIFRPSIAVQQIFSLLKQSLSGTIRLSELGTLFEWMLTPDDLRTIIGQLQAMNYLQPGRAGEWRAGERLNRLADQQANPHQSLSIYSNIKGSDGRKVEIRDQNTQQTIAQVDAQWLDRGILILEGRAVDVQWYDGEAMWISASQDQQVADKLRYLSSRQLLSYDLAQKLAMQFVLTASESPLVQSSLGWLWYHWLGDLYGQALYDLVGEYTSVQSTPQSGLCILLRGDSTQWGSAHSPPNWTEKQVLRYLEDNYRKFESMLDLGPYNHLLPTAIRRRAVIEQFNIDRFRSALSQLKLFRAPESLALELQALLGE